MSLNENLKTRRTQLAVLATVIAVGAATAGGVMWYGNHQEQQKHPAPVAAPNMTGVVSHQRQPARNGHCAAGN